MFAWLGMLFSWFTFGVIICIVLELALRLFMVRTKLLRFRVFVEIDGCYYGFGVGVCCKRRLVVERLHGLAVVAI